MISNIDNGVIIKNGVRCEPCGATITFNLPLAPEIVAECMRHFSALHQFCSDDWPVFAPADAHIVVVYDEANRAGIVAVKANQEEADEASTRWFETAYEVYIEVWTIGDELEREP